MAGEVAAAFAGNRSTYLALSTVTILVLSVLTSIWHSDMSGSIAVLGLLSIYLSSSELLLLFVVLCPFSLVADTIRLSGPRLVNRGWAWLVFFTVCEMIAKIVGTIFAYSLHRSIGAGDGGGVYQSISAAAAGLPGGGAMANSGYRPAAPAAAPGHDDPFASYAPPRADGMNGGGVASTYSPFPTSTQPNV
mmetsp:Transcript_9184/g.16116  ORF Transcript_9184/g.16116 Transcript_9184/m.16116 type:complete len:191 (-) Transcript_9184:642-1214(-)